MSSVEAISSGAGTTPASKEYRIINLKAQNFLKLKAVDITPGKNNAIYITGKNGAGKSSVLKSIWSVFANKELSRDHSSPIREGEETGSVRVDLGEISVTRTWTAEGSYLKVEGSNGAVYQSPQTLLNKLKTNLNTLLLKAEDMTEIDISPLEERLSKIEEINKQVTRKQKSADIMNKLREASKKADAMTEKIEDIDRRKKDLLKTAAFPIKGLSFDKDGVLLNGLPLSQSSTSEQIRVSLSMGMALQPGLRVMLIQDGSLLDAQSRAIVEEMAEAYQMQVWIETVDEEGTAAILIEDGEVVTA